MVPNCISPIGTQTHSHSYRHPYRRPHIFTQDSPGRPFTHPNSNSRHACQSLSFCGSECSEAKAPQNKSQFHEGLITHTQYHEAHT